MRALNVSTDMGAVGAWGGAVRAAGIGAEAGGGERDLTTEVEVAGASGPRQGAPRDVLRAQGREAAVAGPEGVVAAFPHARPLPSRGRAANPVRQGKP